MANNFFTRGSCRRAFFVFLGICAGCVCVFSPIYAAMSAPSDDGGESGDCTWRYEELGGETVLKITPSNGSEGTLGPFSWCDSQRKKTTKRVEIQETVKIKVGSPADSMFNGFEQTKSIDLTGLDVAGAKSMSKMFHSCKSLESLDLGKWNVSNVTDMHSMFQDCAALTALDLSKWNVSNVTDMHSMFQNCTDFIPLGLGEWNVSNVTDMHSMFQNCAALTALDLGKWNVSNVTDMHSMFQNCTDLILFGLGEWNVSNVTDMHSMFQNCAALIALDLSKWNVSNVTNTHSMFQDCAALIALDLSKWNVSNVTDMRSMFQGCAVLAPLDLSKWNVSNVTNMHSMFQNCAVLTALDLSKWNVSNVTDMHGMFRNCVALRSLDLSKWNVSNVTNMHSMFQDCSALASLDLSMWNVSDVADMHSMFQNCFALTSLDLAKWNVSDVADMHRMFQACAALTSLDLSKWNVSSVKNMYSMFEGCKALTSLDLSEWNVSSVTEMQCMFQDCAALVSLDLDKWDVSHVQDMSGMFCRCLALTTLDASKWNVSSVEDMPMMFSGCSALTMLDLGKWDVSHVKDMGAMFQGCSALTTLDLSGWGISGAAGAQHAISLSDARDMFKETFSLKSIALGDISYIKDDAEFEDVGSNAGTHWAQVATGTTENPHGEVFASVKDLIRFHGSREKRQTGSEWYTRVTPKLVITFNKGADDAVDTMEPQPFSYHEEKPLTENAYRRYGYEFDGWRDAEGNFYADKQSFKNTVLGFNVPKTFTAQWKPKKYTVTFDANIPAGEVLLAAPSSLVITHGKDANLPDGSAVKREGYRLSKWTSQADGSGISYQPGEKVTSAIGDAMLYAQWVKKDEAADDRMKRDGTDEDVEGGVAAEQAEAAENADTQGAAEPAAKPNEPVEQAEAVEEKPAAEQDVSAESAEHIIPAEMDQPVTGQDEPAEPAGPAIPAETDQPVAEQDEPAEQIEDPTMRSWAEVGPVEGAANIENAKETKNQTDETKESKVTFTYLSEDVTKGTVSLSSEEVFADAGVPKGSRALPNEGYEFVKWTNNTDSSWTCSAAFLSGAPLEEIAKKDGKFVDTTFTAHFVQKNPADTRKTPQSSNDSFVTAVQTPGGSSSGPGSAYVTASQGGADKTAEGSADNTASLQGADHNSTTPETDRTTAIQDREIPGTGDDTSSMLPATLLLGLAASFAGMVGIVAAVFFRRHERKRTTTSSVATKQENAS